MSDIDAIRRIVMANPALMTEFTAIAEESELFRRTIELSRAHGIDIDESRLIESVRANRRAWLERSMPL